MLAFNVTAEFVTNDFGQVTGVSIAIPPDAITYADKSVSIRSGGSALIPADNLVFTSKTLRLSAGARVNIPVQSLTWTDKAPRITGGRSVYIPHDVVILWSDKTIKTASGGSAMIPHDNLTLSTVFRLSSGGSVYAPVSNLTWTDKTLRTTGGRSVYIPPDVVIVWDDKTARITAGAYIGINTARNMNQNIGSTGDSVTCEFVTCAGLNVQTVIRASDRLTIDSQDLVARAGATMHIPHDSWAITEQRFEVGARHRRLRTAAIAS